MLIQVNKSNQENKKMFALFNPGFRPFFWPQVSLQLFRWCHGCLSIFRMGLQISSISLPANRMHMKCYMVMALQ